MQIQGSKWLVTGGASGMGKHFTLQLAREGADVAFCDLNDEGIQAVIAEYRPKLKKYYDEACLATNEKGKQEAKLSMEAWMDICKGYIYFKKTKASDHWTMCR